MDLPSKWCELGDQRLIGETESVQGLLAYCLGRNQESFRHWKQLAELGQRNGNTLHRAWGLAGMGVCSFRVGKLDDAEHLLTESLPFFGNLQNRVGSIHGHLAHIYARQGRHQNALACGRQSQKDFDPEFGDHLHRFGRLRRHQRSLPAGLGGRRGGPGDSE